MAAPAKTPSPNQAPKPAPKPSDDSLMPFGRMNYIGVIAGIFIVILGFFLMTGEKFIDANEFSKALYISPPLIIIGFAVMTYAIMINPRKNNNSDSGSGQ